MGERDSQPYHANEGSHGEVQSAESIVSSKGVGIRREEIEDQRKRNEGTTKCKEPLDEENDSHVRRAGDGPRFNEHLRSILDQCGNDNSKL